jgi:hypothetical protein
MTVDFLTSLFLQIFQISLGIPLNFTASFKELVYFGLARADFISNVYYLLRFEFLVSVV